MISAGIRETVLLPSNEQLAVLLPLDVSPNLVQRAKYFLLRGKTKKKKNDRFDCISYLQCLSTDAISEIDKKLELNSGLIQLRIYS